MMGRVSALACLALTGALALAAPALPQDVTAPCRLCTTNPKVEEAPAKPVQLDVQASLDFDRLILGGAGDGSAEIRPDGSRIARGSVAAMTARAMVGEVVIRGEPGRQVRVDLPNSIELHGFSGGTIRVESIRSDLPSDPRLDSNGRLNFRFGGVVQVSGNADGEFRGNARIDVEYF
jgi:Domain of unknown function (DUF4402)